MTTNDPVKFNLLADFEAEAQYMPIGVTVRRLLITPTWTIVTAGDSAQLAMAIMVGSENLAAQSPAVVRYEDWMFWDHRGFNGAVTDTYTYPFDIRTGRKLDEVNQELQLHVAANATGVFEFAVVVTTAILLALP